MNKFVSAILLSGAAFVCSMEAHASFGIEDYNGPQVRKAQIDLGNRDDARSQASYTANVTYLQLLDMASSKVLNAKDYAFFMGVANAFSVNGSGSKKTFNFNDYHHFISLCNTVNACKLPAMGMTAELRRSTLTEEGGRAFDLDYAIATIRREAYDAKENGN